MSLFRRFVGVSWYLIVLVAITLALTLGWDIFVLRPISGIFYDANNFGNILLENAEKGILAIGMTFVILSGGIDLSVGSLLALCNMASADILLHRGDWLGSIFAILAAIVIGSFCGFLNGITTAKGKIQPFIVTLAMMSVARGVAFLWNDGQNVPLQSLPRSYEHLNDKLFTIIPMAGVFFIVALALAYFVLNHTPFGRYVYAIGGNEESARLSGINIAKCKMLVYAIAGALCGLAGALHTAKISTATPREGIGFELDAIAMVVIGGTSLAGGKGGIGGTLFGFCIIGVLNNILGLRGVHSYIQMIVQGAIIVVAVLLQNIRRRME